MRHGRTLRPDSGTSGSALVAEPSSVRSAQPYALPVAQVDPEDDSIRRFVVQHYRYDPERHERRHVVVAAFDSKREYRRVLEATAAEVLRGKDAGAAEAEEYVSGVVREPGDRRRQQNARLIARAAVHGVVAKDLAGLELPRNVAFLSSSRPSLLSRLRGLLRRRPLP